MGGMTCKPGWYQWDISLSFVISLAQERAKEQNQTIYVLETPNHLLFRPSGVRESSTGATAILMVFPDGRYQSVEKKSRPGA